MKKTLLLCCFFPLFLTAQEVEWTRFINGAGEEFFDAIATDTEGNIYGGGSFDGSISFDGDADLALGTSDGFLFKASPDGEILWNIVLGGFGTGRVSDIQFADNGNLLVSGYFTEELLFGNQTILSAGQNEWHAFILWITTDGELAQAAQVPCSGLLQTRHFFQAKDGGYYLAGKFRGTLEYGGLTLENAPAGYPGLFVLKLSPQLNVVPSRKPSLFPGFRQGCSSWRFFPAINVGLRASFIECRNTGFRQRNSKFTHNLATQ
ncbi:MAG: hypothetical protein KDD19_27250 [Phaeodactylibacter sp.]|nr:hypothetical protein [Phaeodactylibacter sp.]MCB9051446.1 hypothetical protein [Lewinellaceae bacterium]